MLSHFVFVVQPQIILDGIILSINNIKIFIATHSRSVVATGGVADSNYGLEVMVD